MHNLLTAIPPPPDLLRRFVETPFHARLRLGGAYIDVTTNHAAFLAALSPFAAPASALPDRPLIWKLLADPSAGTPNLEPLFTDSGAVVTAWFGQGNLLAFDTEHNQAFAFLSPGAGAFSSEVLAPLLAGWMAERGHSAATGTKDTHAAYSQ